MRVGLVGCGNWGSLILRDLVSLGATVLVVRRGSVSDDRAIDGGGMLVDSIDSLAGVDGVVIAAPTVAHARVVETCLDLGVPLFVEKPLTASVESAERIVALASKRVFVMDKWRYHPAIRQLRELARSGSLGEVHGISSVRIQEREFHDDVDGTWILLPHDLTIARDVLGEDLIPCSAVGVHDAEWFAEMFATLTTPTGRWSQIAMSQRALTTSRVITVHGSAGTATLDGGWSEHVLVRRRLSNSEFVDERIDTPGELPLLAELRAFVGYLGGGPPPHSTAVEGLAVVQLIEQLRSLALGQRTAGTRP